MVSDAERAALLERGRAHLFAMPDPDAAADLCAANLAYGLAKIHFAQQHYGYPPDATFIGTPDMTITRNSGRWRAGIGYGGRLSWGDGMRDLMILDAKPNTCGTLIAGLRERPDLAAVTERLHDLQRKEVLLDGVAIEWDFGTGNHFVDVFETDESSPQRDLLPYYAVVHASGAELRAESEHGPGLYWDDSSEWQRRCEVLATPWGPLHVLRGADAEEYVALYWRTDSFAMRRRLLAAEALFGDIRVVSNMNHQGLLNPNEVLLGCQRTDLPEAPLLGIMVRADRPAFLLQGLRNLSLEQAERLGFRERAEEFGVLERLLRANILPHGSGYSLPYLSRVRRVIEIGETRYFELERAGQTDTQVISEPRDLTWGYRDEDVVFRAVEYGLGAIAAKLNPLFALKT